ncbi:MAG: DUF438 domain-containing protein [Chloroflexi bacterium]|nr:DUF438 domain-containing protein [Chloroflexota bacterium]
MVQSLDRQMKKEIMKDLIRKLHQGLSVEAAKERFEKEVGTVTSTEIADIEQGLINEGLSPEEIKKFCNVHALLFQSALAKAPTDDTFPGHPVYLFKLENREIEKLVSTIKETISKQRRDFTAFKTTLEGLLLRLKEIETHYERKEQLLFPFLERHGFMGPSKVMWGKDNEIRDLLRAALADCDDMKAEEFEACARKTLDPLLEEVSGMIFKEENILFPTSLEKLTADEWVDILRESDDVGYVFITKPEETEVLVRKLKAALLEEPISQDNAVAFPSGTLRLKELMHILNTLPIDMTFVDSEDMVRYFSEGKARLFRRTRSVLGRKVQNCHPPQSLDVVEKILTSFKEGTKDTYDFWINFRGKYVYIQYLAVRDEKGQYLGSIEVTQEISKISKLEGEKRLLDERA